MRDVLISSGSEFHAEGPATGMQRFPNFVVHLGRMRWLCVAERSVERCWTSVTLVQNCRIVELSPPVRAFELHSLRNAQPVKFVSQKWRHVVVLPPAVDNSDCVGQNRVNALRVTSWEARKNTVAIVYSGHHEAVDQLDGRRCRNRTSTCSNPSKLIKQRAHQHIDVGWHIHRFVELCTQVSDGWGWSNIAVRQMQRAVLNKT